MGTITLGLHPAILGTETQERTNHFTGAKLVVHVGDRARAEQIAAADAILALANATHPDPEGFRTIRLTDERYINVAMWSRGGKIEIEGGLYLDAVELVFRLASASGMLVTSTIDPAVVAVLPGQRHPGIDGRWPTAQDIDSPELLLKWIATKIV
jgi:hypothetical protein